MERMLNCVFALAIGVNIAFPLNDDRQIQFQDIILSIIDGKSMNLIKSTIYIEKNLLNTH